MATRSRRLDTMRCPGSLIFAKTSVKSSVDDRGCIRISMKRWYAALYGIIMNIYEKKYCEYLKDSCGSFYNYLIKAIELADEKNEGLLKMSFPELVKIVRQVKYKRGYLQKLKTSWNDKFKGNKF